MAVVKGQTKTINILDVKVSGSLWLFNFFPFYILCYAGRYFSNVMKRK